MRLFVLSALVAASLGYSLVSARAQTQDATGPEAVYHAPTGEAPPVAPPLRKGSPLDHLANDPRIAQPVVGYTEGNTNGTFWIAHRLIDPMDGQGWGWVRKNGDDWGDAKWIALQETPGLAVAPHRKLLKADGDLNWEYRFWGKFATYKAYDPRLDEQLPVFILQGYQVIGQAAPLDIKVGPPNRIQHRASGASSRAGRPILSDPGVD
jgi:hypothetical protein